MHPTSCREWWSSPASARRLFGAQWSCRISRGSYPTSAWFGRHAPVDGIVDRAAMCGRHQGGAVVRNLSPLKWVRFTRSFPPCRGSAWKTERTRQTTLGSPLPLQQPVQCLIQLTTLDGAQLQFRMQAAGTSLISQGARRGQPRGRLQNASHNHRDDQVPFTGGLGGEQAIEAQLPEQSRHDGHMAIRE